MRFTRFIIQNFKTFRDKTEFNLSKNAGVPGRNVFLIGGMNGAGKTSILDAVNLCLYGEKKLEKIFKDINQYELEKGNCDCSIELQFEMDNADNISLKRSWSVPYSFSSKPTYADLKEKIAIAKNGRMISDPEQQSFLEYIKAEIPEGITQFFFFDGEKIQHIAADEYAAMDLKNSMEAALGIQHIHKLIEDLDRIKRDERKDETGISNEDVRLKETELEQLKIKKSKQLKQIEEVEGQLTQLREILEEQKTTFQREFGFDSEDTTQKERNEKLQLKLTSRLSEIDLEMKNFIQDNFAFSFLIPHFDKIRNQIQQERKLRVDRSKKGIADTLPHEIITEVKNFEEYDRKKPLTDYEYLQLSEKITAVINKFIKIKGSSEKISELIKESDDETKKILVKMDEIEKSVSDKFLQLIQEKNKIQIDLETLDKELRKKTFEGSKLNRFNEIQKRIEVISNDIGEKTQTIKQITSEMTDLSRLITDRETQLEESYAAFEKSTKKGVYINKITIISKLLTEYVDQLRAAKINQLEQCTFQMFRGLLSKGESVVDLSINPDTYLISVKNDSGQLIRKESLSAGEKEIFAISLLWGLAQTSHLKLPIIIDTPLSRLDSTHRDRIVSNYFPNAGHQVIILSTDTEVDKKYYDILESHLQDAIHLKYNSSQKVTTIEEGYFWRSS
jgi:DNA sulfur modification protein DndD